ncbi:ABC transporter substrate-binding protein [Actinopolymorpha pittospori]|uniref:Peptide/nickel transport system substrate-binding protein n=1 Tax=Actinopolymorpha pittospori TaxID=648752 RepID=A0A927N5S6_9ACTN|nr:ABC transporter substrate-binding protein [Actinopolymorpha pittospori]MBE1610783.1 peptide/nickel transport system substrate-binding protein [Actinopolymorpha pittospori]
MGSLPRRFAILLTLAVLALTAACSAGSGTTGETAGSDTSLDVGFIAEPASLDFTRNDGAAIPQALLVNVYEGLVKLDAEGRIVPLLAKSWQVSPDRRTYTFTLRDGVTFSDGKPFTAQDAAFSIDRVKTSWTTSLKTGMDVVARAEPVSATTLKVTLKRPSNSWLFAMTTRIGAMFSRTGVADLATKPIGTGPFVVEKWTRGDSMVLTARDGYWGKAPAVQRITLRYFKDPTAMNNAMRTGGIDVISTVQAPESLPEFSDTSKYHVIEGTSNGEVVLSYNNSKPPLTDRRVRQALSYAIDRKAVLDTAWAGHGTLIGSMVPPTDPWYEDLSQTYPYDPAKARQLLAQAGHPTLTLRLRIPNLPYAVASAQVVKSQLAQVGVTARIDVLEFPARWLDEVYTKADYDMSIISHVEPRDITSWGNPDYYWRYDNPRVQQLLAQADSGTAQQQVDRMKQVARTLAEDAAADWLFLLPNLMVADPGVRGLPTNVVSEAFDLTAVSVARS